MPSITCCSIFRLSVFYSWKYWECALCGLLFVQQQMNIFRWFSPPRFSSKLRENAISFGLFFPLSKIIEPIICHVFTKLLLWSLVFFLLFCSHPLYSVWKISAFSIEYIIYILFKIYIFWLHFHWNPIPLIFFSPFWTTLTSI